MLSLNLPRYLAPDLAPQMHSGSADFLPSSGTGEAALVPPGCPPAAAATLPSNTWGAAWAQAPDPGQPGVSRELLAVWTGLAGSPPVPSDQRVPSPLEVHERHVTPTLFTGAAQFQAAVAQRQAELGRNVACFDASGVRYADLNVNQPDGATACETRDVFRLSDNVKLGEAFLVRTNNAQTTQHWVMFTTARFDEVKVVKRTSGGYASVSAFLSALAAQKPSGTSWPHVVETCTHYLSCPW